MAVTTRAERNTIREAFEEIDKLTDALEAERKRTAALADVVVLLATELRTDQLDGHTADMLIKLGWRAESLRDLS